MTEANTDSSKSHSDSAAIPDAASVNRVENSDVTVTACIGLLYGT